MDAEAIINKAIDKGQAQGLTSLSGVERSVFLISEAEINCDMEGIESLLDRYPRETIDDCALAFRAVGASEIAESLQAIVAAWPNRQDELLDRANTLITDRTGYDYESILEWVRRST